MCNPDDYSGGQEDVDPSVAAAVINVAKGTPLAQTIHVKLPCPIQNVGG